MTETEGGLSARQQRQRRLGDGSTRIGPARREGIGLGQMGIQLGHLIRIGQMRPRAFGRRLPGGIGVGQAGRRLQGHAGQITGELRTGEIRAKYSVFSLLPNEIRNS